MKDNKEKQVHIRMTDKDKNKIKLLAKNNGYDNISRFIIETIFNGTKLNKRKTKRIYTFTISPTLDYYINVLEPDIKGVKKVERSSVKFDSGGRGINTSKILREFNVDSIAVYIAGGFVGEKLHKIITEQNIEQYRIVNDEETRINVNIFDGNDVTSLEERTGTISETSKMQMIEFVNDNISSDDIIVFSGSYVNSDSFFVYKLLQSMRNKTSHLYINSSSSDIKNITKDVKPEYVMLDINNSPKQQLITKTQIKNFCKKFIDMGVENVSFFVDVNYTYHFTKNKMFLIESNMTDEQINTVGLSDAFIGGYLSNMDEDIETRLKWASASQKAMSFNQTSIRFDKIADQLDNIKIINE